MNTRFPASAGRILIRLASCAALLWAPLASAASLETGASPLVFSGAGEGARDYARTTRADFTSRSFQAEVTVTIKSGGGGNGCAYFGIGRGEANPGQFHEPSTKPSLFCRLAPGDFAGGAVDVEGDTADNVNASSSIGDGTHRIRLTWDAAGKRAMFEVCRNWDGKTFHSNSSATVTADKGTFGADAHLFAGGANGVTFADFTVRELSDSEIKAAGFGENFAHDPTAGTWLPLTPVTRDGIRPLVCWYDGPRLAATRAFTDGALKTTGSKWACKVTDHPVTGEPDAGDLDVTFKLTDGVAKSAGVAVAIDIAGWSASNYVLIPASVYNGNRNRVEHRGYATGLDRDDLYKKDLQLTTGDLPHLAMDPGQPSKVEVASCNATTPAICFYNRTTKRAFIILAEQGIPGGDGILDNGLSIEENPDRTRAALVISAPGVREQKPEFIGFSASPDRGIDWKPGDEIRMHLRTYSFQTPDVTGLLDKFMTVRKAVTGPNHPRNLIPFSEITRLLANRIDSRFYSGKDSQFYCPENAAWISFGWIGGLMDTFPMLALGDAARLDRVTKTFDFAIPLAQGKAGYFYGALDHDGKPFGREGYNEHPEIVLTRKNGDVLFWMLKQFLLLDAQDHSSAIKPAWRDGVRRLADAFAATWKKDGQWGNFLNVDTGEVAVYNTSSGVSAIGGMALASQYFHNPEYLKIAEAAAQFHYTRDIVGLGMCTGACADILQNSDSETPAAFMESLMALYEVTGDRAWLEKSRNVANLCATWVISYDYQLPPNCELAHLGAKMAGAVWASTQNKHGAPGFCTKSGDPLFKIYRATGDRRYADLMRDVAHAHAEGIQPDGEITERLTYCDAEMRGSRGSGSTGWNELNGILIAMELPGIYLRTDIDRCYVFDHVEARVHSRGPGSVRLTITNPTKFNAKVTLFAENARQAQKPQGYTAFLNWPSVAINAGQTIQVTVSPSGVVTAG